MAFVASSNYKPLTKWKKKSRLNLMKKVTEAGQALVLVLLSLAVVITIVLFVLSRSVTDINISDSESQSVSAFSAAEAGVEQALVIGSGTTATIGDASYTSQVTNVATGTTAFIYPVDLNSGDTMTLWFRSQDGSPSLSSVNSLRVCWGKPGTSGASVTTPAIETSVFYQTAAGSPQTARIFRATADPYTARPQANAFSPAGAGTTIAGKAFAFCSTLNLSGLPNLQFAIVKMFYNTNTAHPIGFDTLSAAVFPTQGITVDSSGTSGQSSRKVQVFQSWAEVPSAFLSALYSPTGLTK